ncbi:metalloregulator ArsR/SmtB family transcription factor [Rapidithrix thailandica]|uniref:Metalloregulator ArsR/SmtB family transcription factor n=1 Tax=Rapidithrix thailandica TaxID=413964 RepID=A0AAW9S2C9_9BACT
MIRNKKSAFCKKELALANFAKAISHPARIAILQTLAEKKSCICGEIVEALPLAQSTVSQHLKELKNAGLIKGTIQGPRSCYCIDWEAFNEAQYGLDTFLQRLNTLQSQKEESCC